MTKSIERKPDDQKVLNEIKKLIEESSTTPEELFATFSEVSFDYFATPEFCDRVDRDIRKDQLKLIGQMILLLKSI